MQNKYKAEAVTINGITYASQKEARHYYELRLRERAGDITELKRQVKFELLPPQKDKDGKCIERSITYIADFTYKDKNGNLIVEDVKGYKKGEAYKVFTLKRKLMLYFYNIQIQEI